MSYTPTNWIAGATKLGPTNLNHLELGVQAAAATADAANTLAAAALPTPAGSNGQFLKRVGGVWVPTTFAASDIPGYPSDVSKVLAGDGTWKQAPKVTAQLFSSGPPSSPADGDIWIALAVDTGNLATTSGTTWQFRYNASSGSSFKWERIGGAPLLSEVATAETTASTSYADIATVGPTITLARAGDYEVEFGADMVNNTATDYALTAIKRGSAAAADADSAILMAAVVNGEASVMRKLRANSVAAADVYKLQYRVNGGTGTFQRRWLSIAPLRIA